LDEPFHPAFPNRHEAPRNLPPGNDAPQARGGRIAVLGRADWPDPSQADSWPPLLASHHSEEATPDCDYVPVEPNPAKQRLRHLARLGVDRWHAAGIRGKGIKIAVLDTGFRGYRSYLGKALPAKVTARSFRQDGNLEAKDSQHGILCSEVLHALAPEAELLLANWDTDSPEQFLEAARWAKRQGARIISCSIIMPGWSDGEGGGYVNQTLAAILGAGRRSGDLLCFASAGNTAQRHWYGNYHDDGAGFHEWRQGKTSNAVTPWGDQRVSVEIYWQPGESDYELTVTDDQGEEVGERTVHRGKNHCCTTVHFLPKDWRTYQAQVSLSQGEGGAFHLVVLGGGLEYSKAEGSVACPADGPGVLAIGAASRDGCRASYSSCGPNSRLPKPDLVAPVPFASLWRKRPFTGTSAAAPQAAGLAALLWSRHPDWSAEQIRQALRGAARDLGPPGHDCETGYGLLQLPADSELPRGTK
jgi:subtilisin family serine protease